MNSQSIEILNELLGHETATHLERFVESEHFLSWVSARHMLNLRRMLGEQKEHERWLTDEILRLDGAPRPRTLSLSTAGTHYLDVQNILPRILREKDALIDLYRRAIEAIPANSRTGQLLARIRARHEQHVADIRLASATAAP
ncbi:MAG: hypothetical protein CHACPFDD_01992 [Phycisphaerae bacterium]|nr:hypothetical protein [Phycisphaerae bacterium]